MFAFIRQQKTEILLLAVGATISTLLSFAIAHLWLTPLLGAAVAYPSLLMGVRRQHYWQTGVLMLLWGVFQSVAVGLAAAWFPERAAMVIVRGSAVTTEMLHWIATGEGPEGSLRLFLPIHLRNYVLFCSLCCLSVSSAALFFGTYLLNYMNFYVAQLVGASVHPGMALLVGWPIWSVLRVVGFILTGVALAVVSLKLWARSRRQRFPAIVPWSLLRWGVAFVVADIVVKATLAPLWRSLLHYALLGTWI
ncbi:MAG: hypothetical protein F6J87_25690 [Spirulina sp. SIO3F2]|nr:hypothetical protein [Spirulina sp. SIO3F2]